jgi:hypothetical protein
LYCPNKPPFWRAARWDGVCLKSIHAERRKWLTLDDFRACLAYVQAQRASQAPFEVVMSGETFDLDQQRASDHVRSFEEAGATWWVEEGLGYTLEELRARIHRGPPKA